MKKISYIVSSIIACLFSLSILAQDKISATLNRETIKIGETVELTLKTQTAPDASIVFPKDIAFQPFELLEQTATDTIKNDGQWEWVKKYTLIQFDSGTHHLKPLPIFINKKEYATPEYKIYVSDVEVDTTKQPMYDIKATIESTTEESRSFGYWIALALAAILAAISYFIVKYIQGKNLTEEDHYRTPLERLTKKLKNVDAKKQIVNGDIKGYYSEITFLLRDYIEEVLEIPAKESTSTELIQMINQMIKKGALKLNKDIVKQLNNLLQTADLVKFAKVEPSFSQIETDRKTIDLLSTDIDKTVSTYEEEQRMRVYLRERRYRKRKQWRIFTPITVASAVLLITGIVYVNQIFDEGRQWSVFQSNKLLYKREWATSAYGYPTIHLSTPEPMLRITKMIDTSEDFLYQNENTQLWVYVSTEDIKSDFYQTFNILDENNKPKVEEYLNLKLSMLSSKFHLISPKFDKVKINDTTWKTTVVFSQKVQEKTIEMSAEIYLFSSDKGFQMVAIAHPLKDKYGKQIAEKVMNSVQLNPDKNNE